jgi:SAM-dependent methyltransferase
MPKKWFYNWFNSPYYHLLYQGRDDREAQYFITNLLAYLHPVQQAKLLDIACGRGRHAVCFNNRGYHVTGIDLSVANISYARQFESGSLHFFVHDMRSLFYNNTFDIAFNLFTSFGYFDSDDEDVDALKTFYKVLKPGGLLVLDYFNSNKMLKNLIATATKTVEGINFHIQKSVQDNKIIKTIKFEDNHIAYEFNEMVSTFTLEGFTRLFKLSGFEIIDYFGNYSLERYEADSSDRLIFICKKPNV